MDQSAYPALNDQNSTPGSLVGVGYNGGIDRGEFVFGPAAPADSAPVTITAATLTDEAMTAGSAASTSHTVHVYSTSEYTSSSTWNSPPTTLAGPAAATFTTTSATPDQNVSWNVAGFLQAAYNANPWELSLQLQNADETDAAPYVGFSCNPTLAYTYTQPAPVIAAGTGPAAGATFLRFPISDKATLRVNVGSGDALVTTSDLTLPETGGNLTLGADYNSLLSQSVTGGALGAGWRERQGADTRLYLGAGTGSGTASGPVTYLGPDGLSGVFTPLSGAGQYSSPAALHATLTDPPTSTGLCVSGSSYQLTWHSSGQVMCFNNAGMLSAQYDRDGNATAFTYAGNGQETQVSYTPDGLSSPTETVTAAYTGSYLTGLSESGGSAGTKSVTYQTNSDGDLTLIKQADDTTITMGYDGSEDPTSIENGAGATTQITYNAAHQVTSVTQPYGSGSGTATTRFSYVSATETQVAAPNTNQADPVASVPNTTYTVNSQALVTATRDPGSNTTGTAYNSSTGNVASSTNQLNGTTTNTYGSNNGESLTKSVSPTSASQSWAYTNTPTSADPTYAYLPSSSTDAQSNATSYTYDGPGDLQSSQNALAATASVHYNGNGTVQYSTTPAPDSAQTSYTYGNAQNPAQLTEVTPPSGGGSSLTPTQITYDGFGRIATVTNGDGDELTYTYDLADRVTKEAFTGPQAAVTVSYSYDGAGNLHTQTDPSGTTTWTYDGRNQTLTKNAQSGGGTMSWTYDADGNMLTAADAGGTARYAYNTLDQLSSLTDEAGDLWQFAYNQAGQRLTSWFDTNAGNTTWAARQAWAYDTAGRITSITTTRDSAAPATVSSVSYSYAKYSGASACTAPAVVPATTNTSLLQYSTNTVTGVISQYCYDIGNRLIEVTNDNGAAYNYTYDGDGDITSGANKGAESYNSVSQLANAGYTYDGAGQQTATPGNGTETYNDAGQLTGLSNAGGLGQESIAYSGGAQDEVLSDKSATAITYGTNGQDGQPAIASYTPAGSATDYVIRDQQGDPLGYAQSGIGYAFATDNLGSVTNVINTAGTTVATYTYDPYGHGGPPAGPDASQNLLQYTGALLDPASSNYLHLGDRWYNPVTANFSSQDPHTVLADPTNANHYAYAGDNPANNTDPTGNDALGCVASIFVGAAAVGVVASAVVTAGGTAEIGATVYLMATSAEAGAGATIGFWSGVTGAIGSVLAGVDSC